MLELRDVHFRWHKQATRWILQGVEQSFELGQFVGLVGPNGSGKSTLLRLLSGDLLPSKGEVCLSSRKLSAYSERELARKRAFLHQKSALQFPFTVEEVVQFARYAHPLTAEEQDTTSFVKMTPKEAMETTQVTAFSERMYNALSGGEACRVDIARVLAQQTPILLLDEPTNHLDPRHQVSVLALCQALAEAGALVIAALHDLNLAAQYCDDMLLLHEGRVKRRGHPRQVLKAELLEEIYQIPFGVHYDEQKRPFIRPLYSHEVQHIPLQT